MKIVVAGASGFIGQSLIEEIGKHHFVRALSRSVKQSENSHIEWEVCDLFSLIDAERAFQDVDIAVYLVHSMRPSAHLIQGETEDLDLILADNFLRAAKKENVRQIICLNGLYSGGRVELEELFRQSALNVTLIRSDLILGTEGSAFYIMTRLVDRAPFLFAQAWAQNRAQPVALPDIVRLICDCIGNPRTYNQTIEIAGSESVSYSQLLQKIARRRGRRLHFISVPFFGKKFSQWWIRLVTGAPKALVAAFINGGREIPAAVSIRNGQEQDLIGWEKAVDLALDDYCSSRPRAFQGNPSGRHVVRSVQRLYLPPGKTARDVAQAYLDFLPKMQPWLLKVKVQEHHISFGWRFPFIEILVLEHSAERSWSHRQLFYVKGGLLARQTQRARLEFREISGGEAVISAIHDFQPRMPWLLYRWTQALFHVWMMKQFNHYLRSKKSA
ncbi:MAG: NAD(P)H-binding protein [Bdellovibrio sp.]